MTDERPPADCLVWLRLGHQADKVLVIGGLVPEESSLCLCSHIVIVGSILLSERVLVVPGQIHLQAEALRRAQGLLTNFAPIHLQWPSDLTVKINLSKATVSVRLLHDVSPINLRVGSDCLSQRV